MAQIWKINTVFYDWGAEDKRRSQEHSALVAWDKAAAQAQLCVFPNLSTVCFQHLKLSFWKQGWPKVWKMCFLKPPFSFFDLIHPSEITTLHSRRALGAEPSPFIAGPPHRQTNNRVHFHFSDFKSLQQREWRPLLVACPSPSCEKLASHDRNMTTHHLTLLWKTTSCVCAEFAFLQEEEAPSERVSERAVSVPKVPVRQPEATLSCTRQEGHDVPRPEMPLSHFRSE